MSADSLLILSALCAWGLVCGLAVFVAFGIAREAEAKTSAVVMELAEANARTIEERHDSDYWRGLANWYADHTTTHPSALDCDKIAQDADKWLPVGTPANPVKSPVGHVALWCDADDLMRPNGGRL